MELNYDDVDEQPHGRDDEMDFEGEQAAASSSSKREDSGVHLYPFPAQLAVEAGARRGPVPESASTAPLMPQNAANFDEVGEWSPPEVPAPIGGGQDVRLNALHLTGKPISKLSTSRLFAYISHYGAQPLGLEWINDTSVNVVFQDAASARLALEYLCPPEASSSSVIPTPQDMMDVAATYAPPPLVSTAEVEEAAQTQQRYKANDSTGSFEQWPGEVLTSLLSPRKAHRFPNKLYNSTERDLSKRVEEARSNLASMDQSSNLPDDIPEIYRELEQQDRLDFLNNSETQELRKLQAVIWVRFTIESADVKGRGAAAQSQWYRDHGRGAGKDVVEKILDVGDEGQRPELIAGGSSSSSSQPLLRMGNVVANGGGGGEAGQRGRGNRRAAMDDLDADLDDIRASRDLPEEDRFAPPRDRSASPGANRRRRRNLLDRGGEPPSSSSSSGMYGWGDEEAPSSSHRRGGGGAARADLDEEMDAYSRNRHSLKGGRRAQEVEDNLPQPRGRGRKKAPASARGHGGAGMFGWGDDQDTASSSDGTDEFGRSRALYQSLMSGGGRKDTSSNSLAQRFGPSGGLTLEERLAGKTSTGSRLADRFAS